MRPQLTVRLEEDVRRRVGPERNRRLVLDGERLEDAFPNIDLDPQAIAVRAPPIVVAFVLPVKGDQVGDARRGQSAPRPEPRQPRSSGRDRCPMRPMAPDMVGLRCKQANGLGRNSRPRLKTADARGLLARGCRPTDTRRVRWVDDPTGPRPRAAGAPTPASAPNASGWRRCETRPAVRGTPALGVLPADDGPRTRALGTPLRHNATNGDAPSRGSRR